MRLTRTILIFISTFFTTAAFGQQKTTTNVFDPAKSAQRLLKEALASDSARTGARSDIKVLKDSIVAIKVAEQILFNLYGQELIVSQKPYLVYEFNGYWVIMGTLHYKYGGTFRIILDSYDCKVLWLDHEK